MFKSLFIRRFFSFEIHFFVIFFLLGTFEIVAQNHVHNHDESVHNQEVPTHTKLKPYSEGLMYYNENFSKISEIRRVNAAISTKYNAGFSNHPDFGLLPHSAPRKNVVEILSKRKIDERYFIDLDDTSFFYIQKSGIPLHYYDNSGRLVSINPILSKESSGVYSAKQQPYPTALNFLNGFTSIKCGNYVVEHNRYSLTIIDENNNEKVIEGNWADYQVGDNGAYISNYFPGIDMKLAFDEGQIKSSFIVKSKLQGVKKLVFNDKMKLPVSLTLSQQSGFLGKPFIDDINVNDESGKTQFLLKKAFSHDASGIRSHQVFHPYRIVDNTVEMHVGAELLEMNGVVYPLTIDPIFTAVGPVAAPANAIGSLLSPAVCSQVLVVSFPGGSTPWDFSSTWLTAQTSCCTGISSCFNSDAGVVIKSSCGGQSPAGAGFSWQCTPGCNTPGTWNPTIPFNNSGTQSLMQCYTPSCSNQNLTFTLDLTRFFCSAAGCNCTWATNSCVRLNSWNITLQGRTVEWTNTATPFALSSTTVCAGNNITATSNGVNYGVGPYNITWSFNSSGVPVIASGSPASINFPSAGAYTLYGVVTDACGGTEIVNRAVTAYAIPVANAGSTKSLTCIQTTTIVNGSGGGTYSWTGPGTITNANTANATVNTAGTFSLVVTVNGCPSTPATVAVVANTTPPAASVTGPASVLNCTNTSVNLAANPTTGSTYNWSGPLGFTSTSQNFNATLGGTYNLTVTSTVNGCTATANASVSQNTTAPAASITGPASVLNCTNTSVNLAANPAAGATYNWTGPSGFTSTSQNFNATLGGTYNLTVTSTANGCTATANAAVTQNTTAPAASITGPASALNCTNTSVNLAGNPAAGATYNWTGPSGFTSTSQNFNATLGGTYNLTVTSTANGCTATANAAVTQNTTAPAASITGPASAINCTNSAVNLAANPAAGASYNWTGPSGFTSTSQNFNATLGGTYNLTVTSTANGCTATANAAVTQNTTAPVATTLTPGVLNCTLTSVNAAVTATAGMNYSWTGPGIVSGATTSSPVVNAPGNYVATVTNSSNGCSSTATVAVSQNTGVTNVPATTGSVICTTNTINLSTTNNASFNYTWTAPAGSSINSGQGSSNAVGAGPGNYSVTVLNTTNGCASTSVIAANVNTVQGAPNASSSGVVTCGSNAINLNSTTTGVTFTWTAPAGSSVSSPNSAATSANGAGTYTLFVTNTTNNCTNSITVAPTTNTTPPTANIINSPTLVCNPPTVTINGGPGAGVTYAWNGPGIVGSSTGANVTASVVGVYSLNVTSTTNGCTSTSPATVNIPNNLTTSTLSASAQTATLGCGSNSVVTLTVSATPAGSTYSWSTGAGNTTTVAVSGSGTYTAYAFHPTTGCPASLIYTVNPSSGSPTVSLSSNAATITCLNTTQSTTANVIPSNVSYSWSGPGIVGSSTSSAVTGSVGGTYNLSVTDLNNNCSNAASYVITADNSPITVNGPSISTTVNCSNPSGTITTAPTPAGTFTYSWSDGSSGSSLIVTPTVTSTYSVLVTNSSNGCTGSQSFTINTDLNPPTAVSVSPASSTLTCASPSETLSVSANGATSYLWTDPSNNTIGTGTSVVVSSPGTYSVVAIGANGCSSNPALATISPNSSAPTYSISNSTPSITCSNSSPSVTIAITSSVAISGYTWTGSGITGSTNTNVATFTASGVYSAVIEDVNGCQSTFSIAVNSATTPPSVILNNPSSISCTNPITSVTASVSPSSDIDYLWSGPGISGSSTGSSILVNQSGTYSVVVTNSITGCTNSTIVAISGSTVIPTLTVSSSSSVGISCQPNTATITLDAQSSSSGLNYNWSTGATSQTISTSTPGVYTVTVTDGNNCSSSSTIAVQNNTITPSINAAASGTLPCGATSTSLVATSTNTDVAYSWFGSGIISGSNSAVVQVNQAGTYTLSATDMITGCSYTQAVVVTQSSVAALAAADVTTGVSPLTVNFSDNGSGASSYSWNFGNGSSSISQNPNTVFNTSGTYTVVLLSSNGTCIDSDTLIIKVTAGIGVIPEIFTPNGDGKNDVFYIEGLDSYPKAALQVFNRWGSPVFSENPYKNNWDGSANAAGSTGSGKLPSATYFYILELNDADNTVYKGFIQLHN